MFELFLFLYYINLINLSITFFMKVTVNHMLKIS